MPFPADDLAPSGSDSAMGPPPAHQQQHVCAPHQFAFECDSPNCCASYHQRFLMLLGSLAIFAVAILVLLIWMSIQWRPKRWRRRVRGNGPNKRVSEVDLRSSEETRYLRRMSELNPNIRREIVE